MNVGMKIKKLRKENKDTLQSLALKIGYDYSNLSKVERGIYGASVDLLKRITEVYNVDPNYFFDVGFTAAEGKVLIENDENLTPAELKKKYDFVVNGVEATEDEIKEAIQLIRMLRGSN